MDLSLSVRKKGGRGNKCRGVRGRTHARMYAKNASALRRRAHRPASM